MSQFLVCLFVFFRFHILFFSFVFCFHFFCSSISIHGFSFLLIFVFHLFFSENENRVDDSPSSFSVLVCFPFYSMISILLTL
ncbi:hypothetical protein ZOSMA_18G01340 [Zostera marina]|uniref:Uncharacterized protein n=1 Tax=Zostera marina TaxID=29655 RepID=A0A0K9PPZ2_ZOSMR|nr:hypothetical protein ZOSMA_18G01340 [Zostera marina]